MLTGAIFCLCGFMFVGFDELFPLWSLTDWDIGGLSFRTSNVGLAQGAAGVALVREQLPEGSAFSYQRLVRRS